MRKRSGALYATPDKLVHIQDGPVEKYSWFRCESALGRAIYDDADLTRVNKMTPVTCLMCLGYREEDE